MATTTEATMEATGTMALAPGFALCVGLSFVLAVRRCVMANGEDLGTKNRPSNYHGTVYERPDGTWVGYIPLGYDDEGNQQRIWTCAPTELECTRELNGLRLKLTLADRKRSMTLKTYWDIWLDCICKPCSACRVRYKRVLDDYLKPALGRIQLCRLKSDHVIQLHHRMTAMGTTPARQFAVARLLQHTMRDAAKFGFTSHALTRIAVPAFDPCRPIRPLSEDEAIRFLKAARIDPEFYTMYVLALESGMRKRELLALDFLDLETDRNQVRVRHQLEERHGYCAVKALKGTVKTRTVQVSPATLKELIDHWHRVSHILGMTRNQTPQVLFCSARGGLVPQAAFLKKHWKPVRQRAAMPNLRFSSLRDTCAIRMLSRGVPVAQVGVQLGKSVADTLKKYGDFVQLR